MKKLGINLLVVLTLCVGLIGTALANGKNLKKTVTLGQDIMVNDKLVKKGRYQIKFDAATSSVSVLDDNRDLVTTAKVNIKEGLKKSANNSLAYTTTEKGQLLISITFEGDKRTLHIDELRNTPAVE